MQVLSQVPFDEIRVGDRVKSMSTGNFGFISRKIDVENARRKEDHELLIKWDHGGISFHWHFIYDRVWMI